MTPNEDAKTVHSVQMRKTGREKRDYFQIERGGKRGKGR